MIQNLRFAIGAKRFLNKPVETPFSPHVARRFTCYQDYLLGLYFWPPLLGAFQPSDLSRIGETVDRLPLSNAHFPNLSGPQESEKCGLKLVLPNDLRSLSFSSQFSRSAASRALSSIETSK